MKTLLVIGGSSSRQSINKNLAEYVAGQVAGTQFQSIDLNDFEMPIYSIDREQEEIPDLARNFLQVIEKSDGIVLSLAEHNGSYTVAFKNLLDWTSRIKKDLWSNKPMLLLSTSPGGRGGATVLSAAAQTFPHLGGQIIGTFSLPSFYDHFTSEDGVKDGELKEKLFSLIQEFEKNLES